MISNAEKRTIHCDGKRVAQALSNLILTSMWRSPENQPVEIRATGTKDTLTIEIWDLGPVAKNENLTHFFDRFVKTPSLPSKGAKLAICLANEIIKAHGGKIIFESIDSNGNSIKIQLPCCSTSFGVIDTSL